MKRAKSILYGATALAFAAGSALAADPLAPSDSMMDSSAPDAAMMYEVDENRDGRTDGVLLLEQSDSLA